MNIIWKLVGYVLKIIGKLWGIYRFYFLGHYLIGSGKPIEMPDKFIPILDLFSKDILSEFEYFDILPYLKSKKQTAIFDAHKSIGKFRAKKEDNIIFVQDDYIFYRWCGNPEHDSRNCCQDHGGEWVGVEIISLPPININHNFLLFMTPDFKFKLIWGDFISQENSDLLETSLYLRIDEHGTKIDVMDGFFEKLGKPFLSYKQFKSES